MKKIIKKGKIFFLLSGGFLTIFGRYFAGKDDYEVFRG